MVDDADSAARIAGLERRVEVLEMMVRRLLPAVLETARQVGMRRRHVLLTIDAVKTGVLNPDEFDGDG